MRWWRRLRLWTQSTSTSSTGKYARLQSQQAPASQDVCHWPWTIVCHDHLVAAMLSCIPRRAGKAQREAVLSGAYDPGPGGGYAPAQRGGGGGGRGGGRGRKRTRDLEEELGGAPGAGAEEEEGYAGNKYVSGQGLYMHNQQSITSHVITFRGQDAVRPCSHSCLVLTVVVC